MKSASRQRDLASEFEDKWHERWSGDGPFDVDLKSECHAQWVRFHTLPDSKRYPDTTAELATILSRHNTLLNELIQETQFYLVTTQASSEPDDADLNNDVDPESVLWRTIFETPDEEDPEFYSYRYYYLSLRTWGAGCLDAVLRKVANDEIILTYVAPTDLSWLYHPYDGGMDVFLSTTSKRDELAAIYKEWLPLKGSPSHYA
jgi:hypothetical protein